MPSWPAVACGMASCPLQHCGGLVQGRPTPRNTVPLYAWLALGGRGREPGQQDGVTGRGALHRGLALTWHAGPPTQKGGCRQGTYMKPPLPQHLSPWIKSPRGHERVRALGLSACLLQHFLKHLHISVSIPGGDPHGHSLALSPFLAPRLGDHCLRPLRL